MAGLMLVVGEASTAQGLPEAEGRRQAPLRNGSPLSIVLHLDPARVRRWHLDLLRRIEASGLAHVAAVTTGDAQPLPSSVDLLLSLERMVCRLPQPRASDPLSLSSLARPATARADVTIDLSGAAKAAGESTCVLRPLFDGAPGEAALTGALLEGRAPLIEIEETTSGTIRASGLPSIENAETLCEAIEAVQARLATLLLVALRQPTRIVARAAPRAGDAGLSATLSYARRAAMLGAVRRLYRLCCHAPHWRIGWRWVDGPDLLDRQSLSETQWNVLPDPGHRFYADPVPFHWQGRHFIFVEELDHGAGKGLISVAELDLEGPIGLPRPVLEEPFHLSYPFLIEEAGEIWMVPESSANRTVSLYRANPFPDRWTKEADLLTGIEASDATVVRHGGRWWMFATVRDGGGAHSDCLCLFTAPQLLGPWAPHVLNPVLVDARFARPAGPMVDRNGGLWRPVQDCSRGYGTGLAFARVSRLDEEGFAQEAGPVLRPGDSWPGRRFHAWGRAGRLECIDGSAHSPKWRWLARRVEGWSGRREPAFA